MLYCHHIYIINIAQNDMLCVNFIKHGTPTTLGYKKSRTANLNVKYDTDELEYNAPDDVAIILGTVINSNKQWN